MTKWKPKKKYYVDSNGKRRKIGGWTYVKNPAVREWARNKEQDILAGVEKNTNGEGHVYVFSLEHDNLYKIGITTNVQRRLKALQASNPKMKCVYSGWVKDMKKVEKNIHAMYKEHRIDREVFDLTRDQVTAISHHISNIQSSY